MFSIFLRLWWLEQLYCHLFWVPKWEYTPANAVTVNRFRLGFWSLHIGYWMWVWSGNSLWAHMMLWPFATAVVFDKVDGFVANRYGKSKFGELADPFFDATLMINALMITSYHAHRWEVTTLSIIIALLGMFIWILRIRHGIKTTRWAKHGQAIMAGATMGMLLGVLLDVSGQMASAALVLEYSIWALLVATVWLGVTARLCLAQTGMGLLGIFQWQADWTETES